MNVQKEIKQITKQIVEKYKPEKIILYGSFVGGKPHKDSDLDLLIVKKTKKSRTRRHLEVDRMLLDRVMPLDILVYTPKELDNGLKLRDIFIEEVLNKGKMIYEK